jgi:ubiquitin-protein ligase
MAKRLQKELKEFADEPKDWCKAELSSDENLYLWKAEVYGPVRQISYTFITVF